MESNPADHNSLNRAARHQVRRKQNDYNKSNFPQTFYTVVVRSGSTCCCGVLAHNSAECGHMHRTQAAADRCKEKLIGYDRHTRSCSATWAYAKVIEVTALNHEIRSFPVFDDSAEDGYPIYLHDEVTTDVELCRC